MTSASDQKRSPTSRWSLVSRRVVCGGKGAEELSAGNSTKPYSRLANNDYFQESDASTF